MRFWANLIDVFFMYTLIGGVANIILAVRKTTTLGYLITGIAYKSEDWGALQGNQKWMRLATNFPLMLTVIVYLWGGFSLIFWLMEGDSDALNWIKNIINWIIWLLWVWLVPVGFWNLIEIFWQTPNWVERKLKTRRIQYKKPITWLIIVIVIFLILLARIAKLTQEAESRNQTKEKIIQEIDNVAQGNYDTFAQTFQEIDTWNLSQIINEMVKNETEYQRKIESLGEKMFSEEVFDDPSLMKDALIKLKLMRDYNEEYYANTLALMQRGRQEGMKMNEDGIYSKENLLEKLWEFIYQENLFIDTTISLYEHFLSPQDEYWQDKAFKLLEEWGRIQKETVIIEENYEQFQADKAIYFKNKVKNYK